MCSFGLTICKATTITLRHFLSAGPQKDTVILLNVFSDGALRLLAAQFSSHLCERTRKRYLYTPGRAQFAVRSSWHLGLAPAGREILLWRGSLSSSPWQTRWSGKPLRWCLLDSKTDHLEEKNQKQCYGRTQWEIPVRNWSKKWKTRPTPQKSHVISRLLTMNAVEWLFN